MTRTFISRMCTCLGAVAVCVAAAPANSASGVAHPAQVRATASLDRGLILRYDFENPPTNATVSDVSPDPVAFDGKLVNFPPKPARVAGAGGVGHALVFNRAQRQRIDTGTGQLMLSRFTFSAWGKIDEDDTPNGNWEVGERGGSFWLNVRNSAGGSVLRMGLFAGAWAPANQHLVDSADAVPRHTWVHLAGTFDGSQMKVYLNGRLEGTTAGITLALNNPTAVNEPLRVGAKWSPNSPTQPLPTSWWQGELDDVRLYDRALSATEITSLAQVSAGASP